MKLLVISDIHGIKTNLPLIKEKSFLYENKDETKSKLMNTMTQEIMTNFKKKIHQLESDNKKLTDDLLALTRNFEALSLKHQEDLNLIKRLQSELNKYQIMSNETSQLNIKNDMIKSLQIHNEELINDIKKMEIRYKNEIKKLRDSDEYSNLCDVSDVLKAYIHNAVSIKNYELAFDLIKHYYKEWYRKER